MQATKKACVDKQGHDHASGRPPSDQDREDQRTGSSGGSFAFSKKTNDPLNGSFWLFQIQSDGTAKQLGKIG